MLENSVLDISYNVYMGKEGLIHSSGHPLANVYCISSTSSLETLVSPLTFLFH